MLPGQSSIDPDQRESVGQKGTIQSSAGEKIFFANLIHLRKTANSPYSCIYKPEAFRENGIDMQFQAQKLLLGSLRYITVIPFITKQEKHSIFEKPDGRLYFLIWRIKCVDSTFTALDLQNVTHDIW